MRRCMRRVAARGCPVSTNAYFAAKKSGDDLVLDVFSVIGKSWDGEGLTAKAVSKALADAPKAKRIVVRINSPGGSVFEGNTIVSLLKGSGKTIRTEVHGLAASMGSILALAGDEIVMAEGAMMMIHNPWGYTMGDANQMRKDAAVLDKLREGLLDTYAARSHVKRDEIGDMMDAETWMTATEAIKNGFADSVMAGDTAEALACYRDLPKDDAMSIVASLRNAEPLPAAATLPAEVVSEVKMEDDKSEAPEPVAATDIPMVPRADYDALAKRLEDAEAALAAQAQATREAEAKAHADKVEAALTDALKAGKIVPASEAYHRGCCATAEGLAAFLAFVDSTAPVVVAGPIVKDEPEAASAPLTDNQKRLCAQFGISEDAFRASMKVGE